MPSFVLQRPSSILSPPFASPSLDSPSQRSHLNHSEHIHLGIQRTRGLVSASSSGAGSTVGRSLSTRVALSGALDRLVDDLDGRLGLPVRVELQVVAFRVRVSASFSSLLRWPLETRRARGAAHS
jgi:hypothetical protein